MMTFEAVLDAFGQLPLEQQEVLIDILKKRNTEARRSQILEECYEGLAEYRSGVLKTQTVEEIMADLRSDLENPEI